MTSDLRDEQYYSIFHVTVLGYIEKKKALGTYSNKLGLCLTASSQIYYLDLATAQQKWRK